MTEIYKIGRIYYLCSEQTDDIYIGSTKRKLNDRLSGHKKDYKRYLAGKMNYLTSFELCKYNDCKIYEIEQFNDISKLDLKIIEGNYILNCECINDHIAGRSKRESVKYYHEKNKENILKYQKEYREKNKAHASQKHKCECGGKYSTANKSIHEKTIQHKKYFIQ